VLYRNDGKGYFTDLTVGSGLGVETRFTAWGGLPDLFIATGSVYPEVERTCPSIRTRPLDWCSAIWATDALNSSSTRRDSGVTAAHSSPGGAFGAFENDGDLDVLVFNMNEPPSLLRNDVTGGGHWLKIQAEGTKSNRSGIGARVTVRYGNRAQAQEVHAQSSFYSVNDRRLHFGLGTAATAEVVVREGAGITRAGALPGK